MVGYIIGRIIVSALFIPAYFRGELLTTYELLQRRFGPSVKNLSASIFLLTRSLADGIRLYATALVITVVTRRADGLDDRHSRRGDDRLHDARRRVRGDLDRRRAAVRLRRGRAARVRIAARRRSTAAGPRWSAAGSAANKFQVLNFSLQPSAVYTIWTGLLGGVALTLSTHGTDQYLVQRLLSAKSLQAAQRGLVVSGFIVFAQFVLFLLIGVMLYTFYQQTPLPAPLGRNDEILPLFIIHSLRNGAAGFIVAAIVAAALSPSINAMAATTVNDFYVKYVRPDADDATLLRVSKIATVFWGVVQIGVALGAQTMERSVLDAGLVGAVARVRIGARRVHHRHADAARRLDARCCRA